MAMAKVFHDNSAPINSMDFSRDGELLVTASDDESVRLYNTSTGKLTRTVFSKKYGVDLIRFTHHNNYVICASKNDWDESLRYLSLHDNRYMRYFKGHRDRVVSLSMSPRDDTFISASLDKTIRLWDLRTNACQGLLRRKTAERACVSYDPQGLVFAAAVENSGVRLFDLRSFDAGPFLSFTIEHRLVSTNLQWGTMKFSNDGKYILLSTTGPLVFLADAFTGERKQVYRNHLNANASVLEASFTPDSEYVLSGSEDGAVHVWHALTGKHMAEWQGHAGAVRVVQWHPKAMLVASACTQLAFWLPPPELEARLAGEPIAAAADTVVSSYTGQPHHTAPAPASHAAAYYTPSYGSRQR